MGTYKSEIFELSGIRKYNAMVFVDNLGKEKVSLCIIKDDGSSFWLTLPKSAYYKFERKAPLKSYKELKAHNEMVKNAVFAPIEEDGEEECSYCGETECRGHSMRTNVFSGLKTTGYGLDDIEALPIVE